MIITKVQENIFHNNKVWNFGFYIWTSLNNQSFIAENIFYDNTCQIIPSLVPTTQSTQRV